MRWLFSILLTLSICSLTLSTAHSGGTFEEPPQPSWHGFYFGGHVGAGFTDDLIPNGIRNLDFNSPTTDFNSSFDDDPGGIAGGHIGYNIQRGKFVFGIEGDVSYTDLEETLSYSAFNIPDNYLAENGKVTYEQNYLASIRARLGYATKKFLVYGTLGVAFTEVEVGIESEIFDNPTTSANEATPFKISSDDTYTGFVIGGGGALKLSEKLSMRLEGLYYTFDDSDANLDFDNVVIRGGLTLHLN